MKIRIYMNNGSNFLVESSISANMFLNEVLNKPHQYFFQFDSRIFNLGDICWIDVLKE